MFISYTVVSGTLGYLLVAMTEKGACAVKLGDNVLLAVIALSLLSTAFNRNMSFT